MNKIFLFALSILISTQSTAIKYDAGSSVEEAVAQQSHFMRYDNDHDYEHPSRSLISAFSVGNSKGKRQSDVWEKINGMDDYKSNSRLYRYV